MENNTLENWNFLFLRGLKNCVFILPGYLNSGSSETQFVNSAFFHPIAAVMKTDFLKFQRMVIRNIILLNNLN